MKKILILGGTGFVGRHLCEKLAGGDYRATVLTRRRANARHLQMLPMVDVLEGSAYDKATLTTLLAEHDAVVNLVAILHGTEAAFDKTHVQLPQTLVNACHAAGQTTGLRRIVHVSSLGADINAPAMYQRSKARGEAVLMSSGLDVSVLRPSVIFGAEDKFLNTFASLQKMFPFIPLAGSTAKFQPVWVEDVAAALVKCLEDSTTIGQTFEACGPEVFTLKQLVQLAGQYSGHDKPVIGLPDGLARIQAALMELAPGEPIMSRDNLDAMKVDNISAGKPGLHALGISPAALRAVVPFYLGAQGLRSGLTAKRKTAGRF
ncbi:MAG: complex I NDUFA9 subunit family protein [Polaromonas sp.]